MSYQDPIKREEAALERLMQEAGFNADGTLAVAPDDTGAANPDQTVADENTIEGQQTDTTTAPTAGATPAQPDQTGAEDETWRARFETLNGKYNAEVPRLHAEIRNLKAMLAAPQNAQAAAAKTEETDDYKLLVAEYGEKAAQAMAGMQAQVARTATQEAMKPVVESVQMSAVDRLHADIASQAGHDWLELNDNPDFIAWTKQNAEPLSGKPYNTILNEAYHGSNAHGVAQFFNMFRASQAGTQTHQPTVHNEDQAVTGQQAMVAPTRRATAVQAATDATPGKVWTTSEIDTFYDDMERGRYKGRTAEAKQIEAEIFQALSTPGRVVGGR